MFETVLLIHSWVRWLVFATGALAVVSVLRGRSEARWRIWPFVVALDLQLLLGLALYLVLSPLSRWGGPSALRFWRLDHPALGLISILFGNLGALALLRARGRQSATAMVALCAAFAGLFATIPWSRPIFRL